MKKPALRKNKNTRTISREEYLDNRFCIKFIAGKDGWLKLENLFLTAFEQGTHPPLKDIIPYLSKRTGEKEKRLLEAYYRDDPENFTWELFYYFIEPAALEARVVRSRGGNPHGIDWDRMAEIKQAVRWVYVFLSYWAKQKPSDYPEGLKKYLLEHPYKEKLDPKEVIDLTQEIIKSHYSVDFGVSDIYYNHIVRRSLDRIKKALLTVNYLPVRPPLSHIF